MINLLYNILINKLNYIFAINNSLDIFIENDYIEFKEMYDFCNKNNIKSKHVKNWFKENHANSKGINLENNYVQINYKYFNNINLSNWILISFPFDLNFIEKTFIHECCIANYPDIQFLQLLYEYYPQISNKTIEKSFEEIFETHDDWYVLNDELKQIQYNIANYLLLIFPKLKMTDKAKLEYQNRVNEFYIK